MPSLACQLAAQHAITAMQHRRSRKLRSEPMLFALPFILAALAVLVVGVQILLVVKVADLFEAPRDDRQDVRKVHARYPAVPAGRFA